MDTREEIIKSAHYIENAQQHAQPNVDAETAPYMEVVDPEHTDHIQRINEIIETESKGQADYPEGVENTPSVDNYTPSTASERQMDPLADSNSNERGNSDVQNPTAISDITQVKQRSILSGVFSNVFKPVEIVFDSFAGAMKSYITKPFGSALSSDFNGRTTVSKIAQIAPINNLGSADHDAAPQNVVQFPSPTPTATEQAVEPVRENVSQFPTQREEVQHAA